eukprot:SAG11_NODE_2598_length_3183_cov_4.460765_2_plen_259_part_00
MPPTSAHYCDHVPRYEPPSQRRLHCSSERRSAPCPTPTCLPPRSTSVAFHCVPRSLLVALKAQRWEDALLKLAGPPLQSWPQALVADVALHTSTVLSALGRFSEAQPHYEVALSVAHRRTGRKPLPLQYAYADALERSGAVAAAAAEFERGLGSSAPLLRAPSESDRDATSRLVVLLRQLGRSVEAAALVRSAVTRGLAGWRNEWQVLHSRMSQKAHRLPVWFSSFSSSFSLPLLLPAPSPHNCQCRMRHFMKGSEHV